ncbi:UvrD-helicase domain-containing protein [Mesorhizobium sp. M1163]|uniref:UvrD-helicase domain-containing protein n=1 Tax=unclassified Mesorhizobium TaxID=325217 RepID=UPI003334EC1D
MEYVSLTRETCSWLLTHPEALSALADILLNGDLSGLARADLAAGPLRLSGAEDGRILAIWNAEYLSNTGSESWGIFRLEGALSIASHPKIGPQVIERFVYVISQRLQGLMIEGDFIHRARPNGSHTCLAGRGNDARHYSVCYYEAAPGFSGLTSRSLIGIGPEHDFDELTKGIEPEILRIVSLVEKCNSLVDRQVRRPALEDEQFAQLRNAVMPADADSGFLSSITVTTSTYEDRVVNPYETLHWTFDQWLRSGVLNPAQRRAISVDILHSHPVRIIGPAGSGKTLLMQLIALRYLNEHRANGQPLKVAYIVHNAAMAATVLDRFKALGGEEYLTGTDQELIVTTLGEYGRRRIELDEQMVIDRDAQKTKEFQFLQVRSALQKVMNTRPQLFEESELLKQVWKEDELFIAFAVLVTAEISAVIKGRGLTDERDRYINAEVPFSRFHRILNQTERAVVFDCFENYHAVVFEQYGMLDSDDIALSLAGRLKTPVWELKRRSEGYDLVLVDEAQLFNENERRVFPLLTSNSAKHVPIALALDEAQEPFGLSAAGLGALGISDIENEKLPSNHRSTKEIISLAFFVIQRTTDLFGSEFPDFTGTDDASVPSDHPLASPPVIVTRNEDQTFAKFLVKTVQKLRSKNVRQIAVICHSETYWKDILDSFTESKLPLHVITQRGEKIVPDQPLVVLSRPSFVGGQEFDAVVLVGLEQGIMPPRVVNNPPLAAALEQQVLREIYLTVSRARFRVVVAINRGGTPNTAIAAARDAGMITHGSIV